MIKKFIRDGLIYVIPSFISRGMSIILVPIYTRILSTSDYGALDMITITGTIIGIIISLELTQAVARFYSSAKSVDDKKRYFSTAFWTIIISYSVLLVASLILRNHIVTLLLDNNVSINVLVSGLFFIWSNGIYTYLHNHFRWQLRSKEFSVLSVVGLMLTAVLGVTLAYALRMGIFGLLIAMTTSNLVCSILSIYLQKSEFVFKIDNFKFIEMTKFSIPLVPASIAVLLSNYIDRFMINNYLSLSDLGIYSLGFKLANIIALVVAGFQSSLTPLVYTYHEDKNTPNSLATIFRLFSLASLIMYFSIVAFSQEILWIFTTEQFYSADDVIVFLIPSILFSSMYIFTPGASIRKKTQVVLFVNIFGAATNYLLNYMLIPRFGLQGAAISTLLSSSLVFIINMLFSQKYYHVNHEWGKLFAAAISTVTFVVVTKYINVDYQLSVLIRIIFIILLITTMFSIRMIKRDELRAAKALLMSFRNHN